LIYHMDLLILELEWGQRNSMNKYVNAQGVEFTPNQNAFGFAQKDKKITDKKLDTKATTFIKDAFKRFTKNKSSVVGAIIIGIIIILAIVVPITSPYDVEEPHVYETKMLPKLFESGTGWWDGTKEIVDQAYDATTKIPYGFKEQAIISEINYYESEEGGKRCSFVYDYYEDVYGTQTFSVPQILVERYIEYGYMTMDLNDISTFTILDSEKCPIIEVLGEKDETNNYSCTVCMHKYYGHKEMPKYLFGTDDLGKDLTKMCFLGLRYSLVFSTSLAAFCFLFGLVWGAICGYFGGSVDLIMERFTDILGGIPTIVIVTLFRLNLGYELWVFAVALALTGWMGTAGTTRTQFYRFKGREYVLASRTLGANDGRLIFKHILPNALGTIVTGAVLMIPGLIFTESSLSYLGLGLKGSDSFGTILADNQAFLQTYPMLILFPAFIISLLMISFNLFGNGLRDALNPSLKGSE